MERDQSLGDSLLRLVIDTLPVGVVVIDLRGDVVLSNPAARDIWGETLASGEERWKRSRGWWHASGAPVAVHEWASVRALSEGVPHLDQLVDIEGFDGVRRTIRNSAVPIIEADSVRGAVILNEDVTERLSLASRLAQAQKLEALGQLAGGVAHDFNNVLQVISNFVEVAARGLAEDDRRREHLGEIRRAADSGAGLTRQLLAFARCEPSKPHDVVVDDLVGRISGMLQRILGTTIRLNLKLDAAGSATRIDPSQLEQVLMNLVVNARDAMAAAGELFIETRRVDYPDDVAIAGGLPRGGPFIALKVRDTGVGMDERTRAQIFEPFFTTKERGRGTGLGLATVYAIVRERGGTILVESEPGRGTTFSIDLPSSSER